MELRWEPRVEDWSEAFEAKARAMKPRYQVRMSPYAFLRGLTIFLALNIFFVAVEGILINPVLLIFPAVLLFMIWRLWHKNPHARPGLSTPDVIAIKLMEQDAARRGQVVQIDEAGIHVTDDAAVQQFYAWPDVKRVLETDRMFVAVVRPDYAKLQAKAAVKAQARVSRVLAVVPLPKRGLDDVASARELLSLNESGTVTPVDVPEPRQLTRPGT